MWKLGSGGGGGGGGGGCMWWPGFILLVFPCSVFSESVSLGCQKGWTSAGMDCYRLFPQQVAWDIALDVCQRYGSHPVRLKDAAGQEEALGALLAQQPVSHVWLGHPSIPTTTSHQHWDYLNNLTHHHPHHHDHHHHHLTFPGRVTPSGQELGSLLDVTAGGQGEEEEEEEGGQVQGRDREAGQCVLARWVEGGRMVWGVAPCSRLTSFVCVRPAAPEGSFHCSQGGFVQQAFVCDGEDDCGDASDELDCKEQCSHHIEGTSGVVITPDWSDIRPGAAGHRQCLWLLEAPVGYNAHLEFTDMATDWKGDEIVVLMGGTTVSTSREVARFCGDEGQRQFVSVNNLLIVVFTSENLATASGFSATFTAVRAEGFEPHQELTATSEVQRLLSPFYPGYLSGQDYVWVITALQPSHILTLQILDLDLSGSDMVEIRDGNSVYASLLHVLTSQAQGGEEHVTYVQSTGRQLFIALRTRSLDTGQGFRFKYWQGCSIRLKDKSGAVVSPGYSIKGANYPTNQTCVYDVIIPEQETSTLIFDTVDIHDSDSLKIESNGQFVHTVRGSDPPDPIDLSGGTFRLTFSSGNKLTARGFSLRYSVGCPRLALNSRTTPHPQTLAHHFGSALTLTCSHGYAFPPPEPRPQSEASTSLVLECLFRGVWNTSSLPLCQVQCRAGWFYDARTETCDVCPHHFYQSEVNATSCTPCPPNTVTEREGSNSSTHCKTACKAGQRYCHSLGGCEDCPKGTYQSGPAQFACVPCPLFRTTLRPGANTSALCSVAVMDKETEQELNDQEFIVVSFQDHNPSHHHHHHHHHHHRHRNPPSSGTPSPPRTPGSLSSILLPSGRFKTDSTPRDRPQTAPEGTRKHDTGPMTVQGSSLSELASRMSDGQTPRGSQVLQDSEEASLASPDLTKPERSRWWALSGGDDLQGSRRKSSDVVNSEWTEGKTLGWAREEKLWSATGQQGQDTTHTEPSESERVKRQASKKTDEMDDTVCSGSGMDDPCNTTLGQQCNDTQDCEPDFNSNSFKCVCKATYLTDPTGQCVELPENYKLFLTTPLALTFNPDLSLQRSIEFLTFQKDCVEAFTDIFRGVEGWKAVQVLFFRSEEGGNEQTVVAYALLFSVGVTGEMKRRVALTVLQMESYKHILIGCKNFTQAGHTGIFNSLTGAFTSSDDVDWCGVASLHNCKGDKRCVDGGLRYTCQCPDSTFEVAGACASVGAVVGGVIAGIVIIVIVIVFMIVVIRRRRKLPHQYLTPQERKREDREQAYIALTPPQQHFQEDAHPERADDSQPANLYSDLGRSSTAHNYDAFQVSKDGGSASPATPPAGSAAQQSEDVELVEPNIYHDIGGPLTAHQYEAFHFGRQDAEASDTNPYANMAVGATSGAATLSEPVGTFSGSDARDSGLYMNLGRKKGSRRQDGKDPVYSNIGHQL